MVFTDALDVDIGDNTRAVDHDTLADNPEWLRDKANQEHDFDISTGDGSHKDITFGTDSTYSIGTSAVHALGLFTDAALIGAAGTAPDGTLHVLTSEASAATPHANYDDLIVEHATTGGMTIIAPTVGGIAFGDVADSLICWLAYTHASNSLEIATNNAAALTIDSSQNVDLPVGLTSLIGTFGSTTAAETDLLVENDLWIGGDDANANRSGGMNAAPSNLVINNDVASNYIFFRAKDAGITTTYNTTDSGQDDMLVMAKNNSGGGVKQYWMGGDTADTTMNEVLAIGGTASTTHTTAGRALLEFSIYEVSSGNLAVITADGNVFGIRDNGGALLLLDEDGDLFIDGTSSSMDFKDDGITPRDDLAMLSALDYVRDPGSVYRTEWEDFVSVKEPDLIAANILGGPVAEGGMLNLTGLAQLHTGGIRQLERKKADRIELAREVEQRELLEATVAEQQVLLLEAHDIIERLSHQLEEGKE